MRDRNVYIIIIGLTVGIGRGNDTIRLRYEGSERLSIRQKYYWRRFVVSAQDGRSRRG